MGKVEILLQTHLNENIDDELVVVQTAEESKRLFIGQIERLRRMGFNVVGLTDGERI